MISGYLSMPQSVPRPSCPQPDSPVWTEQEPVGQQQGVGRQHTGEMLKYGELVILGYNGALPQGDKGRRRSKFVLYR